MNFDWYTVLQSSGELQQGDFIPSCPIIVPPAINYAEVEELDTEVVLIDSIILSQSCDLVNGKITNVLVCPYISLSDYLAEKPAGVKERKKIVENLRKGLTPGYHLLNKAEEVGLDDYQVVDFRNVYGIHLESIQSITIQLENRVRLLPPYREHLSQSFARYFMRVGLPQDIQVEGY